MRATVVVALVVVAYVTGRVRPFHSIRTHVDERIALGWHGGVIPKRGPLWWRATVGWSWVALWSLLRPIKFVRVVHDWHKTHRPARGVASRPIRVRTPDELAEGDDEDEL